MGYHHGDLHTALLDAAERLLEEGGPDAVSVRKAARQAGVSASAPYRHFADRDALMSALAARGHRQLQARMQRAMQEAGENRLLQLRAQGISYVLMARERPAMFRTMHTAAWMAPGASPEMDAVLADLSAWTADLAAEAQAAGELSAAELAPQVLACRALVYGLARMFVDGHAPQLGIEGTEAYAFDIATDAQGNNTAWLAAGSTLNTVSLESGKILESWEIKGADAPLRDITFMTAM